MFLSTTKNISKVEIYCRQVNPITNDMVGILGKRWPVSAGHLHHFGAVLSLEILLCSLLEQWYSSTICSKSFHLQLAGHLAKKWQEKVAASQPSHQ